MPPAGLETETKAPRLARARMRGFHSQIRKFAQEEHAPLGARHWLQPAALGMDVMDPVEIAAGLPFRDGKSCSVWRSAHRKSFPNCWDLIGGLVEVGETAEKALVRQFQEESASRRRIFG